jgi:lipopolysaccharide export system protein LptA
MTARLAFATVLFLGAASSTRAQGVPRTAQQGAAKECDVRFAGVKVHIAGVNAHDSLTTSTRTSGKDTTWVSGGVDAKCAGTDQRVLADSAEQYTDRKLLILIGHVHYTEERLKLDSDRLTYFTGEERLLAEGHVVGVTNTGTRFLGPHAEYLRPAVGIRLHSHLDATPRANSWVSPKDAGSGSKDSVNIQADHIIVDNDSLVYAKGIVVIERPDLLSTSDSAFLDNGTGFARLTINPKVVGRGDRHFTLDGEIIDIFSKKREVDRVKSMGKAVATSDDVTLKADTIDLRITNQKLERAYAWGPARAHAHSKDEDITADSIDVVLPGQTLRTMRSVGKALAESTPDSAKIVSKKLDYLSGETIVAEFDSVSATDTVKQPAVRVVTAHGVPKRQATSYYQVVPNGQVKTDKPNVDYQLGDSIMVTFRKRQVDSVFVFGRASGFYIEAVTDSARTKPDSTKAASDSAKKAGQPPAAKKKP